MAVDPVEVELDTGELCPIAEAGKCVSCSKYGVKEDMNACAACDCLIHYEDTCSKECEAEHILCRTCDDKARCPVCEDWASEDDTRSYERNVQR